MAKKQTSAVQVTQSPVSLYLIIYNIVSCLGWSAVLLKTLNHVFVEQETTRVYELVHSVLNIVQSMAFLEILHSLLGFVKASVFPTIMQVSSRLFIIWGILGQFNDPVVRQSPFVTSMIIAWCCTEIIRYSYFALLLSKGVNSPYFALYLRYTAFYILYPIGAGSEFMLVNLAHGISTDSNVNMALAFMQGIYPGGFAFMYKHMMGQRQKYLYGIEDSKKKKQ